MKNCEGLVRKEPTPFNESDKSNKKTLSKGTMEEEGLNKTQERGINNAPAMALENYDGPSAKRRLDNRSGYH
jgi:hypothetical protein